MTSQETYYCDLTSFDLINPYLWFTETLRVSFYNTKCHCDLCPI